MDKQINQLNAEITITGNELFPIWGNNKTNQTSILSVKNFIYNDLQEKIKSIDGANSGIDADLLDGKHASAFINKGSDATKLLLSNGETINYYKSANITTSTSDDGALTPLGMKTWTEKTFVKPGDITIATEKDIEDIFK